MSTFPPVASPPAVSQIPVRLPLVKGSQTYPFFLSPLPAFVWTSIAARRKHPRPHDRRAAFLERMETPARDRLRDRTVREDERYDYATLRELVEGYYAGRHRRAEELDWWLALDAWWSSLAGR